MIDLTTWIALLQNTDEVKTSRVDVCQSFAQTRAFYLKKNLLLLNVGLGVRKTSLKLYVLSTCCMDLVIRKGICRLLKNDR